MFSPLLLLFSITVGIAASSSSSLSSYQSLQQQYYELLASYEDDDINSPPGPTNGWPHTQPYTTNYNDLVSYNKLLEQRMYITYQEEYFAIYSGDSKNDDHMLHISQIGRPEGSTTGYYTGVTHFPHVNNKNLITFLFSAGRHDGGTNTYFTIDTTEKKNPFSGIQELYIDEKDVSTWTWVSSYTVVIDNDEEKVSHYALFSGGSGGGKVGPSKLHIFQEDSDGQLILPPTVEWIEDISTVNGAARFCLLTDLGNIYNTKKGDVELVSNKGMPDIIISGTGGLYIYSKLQQQGDDWKLVRSISIHKDLNDDTSAFVGLEYMQDERHLVIAARTKWSNRGQEFNAPTLIYDYQNDKIVQELSSNGQTVSVALVDDKSRLLVSAGGQSGYTGQPNLMFDVSYINDIEKGVEEVVQDTNTTDQPWRGRFLKQIEQHQRRNRADSMIVNWNEEESESSLLTHFQAPEESEKSIDRLESYSKASLELSDTQLARDMPLDYTTFDYIDPVPVSSEDYFVIPSPGKTRTRQVLPFQLTNNTSVDLILEINSAQTCNIYYRTMANETATKIMPLPGSEGRNNQDEYYYTRAGDVLVIGDQLYIILAQYNGNNTVYSFSTSVF